MSRKLLLPTIISACWAAAALAQPTGAVIDGQSVTRGRALFEAGRYDEAEPLLAGALAAIDAGRLSRQELGRCLGPLTEIYHRTGRHEDTLRTGSRYDQFLRAAAGNNTAAIASALQDNVFLIGQSQLALARYDEAKKSLEGALRIPGGNRRSNPAWALNVAGKLAELASLRGERQEATARRQRLVEVTAKLVDSGRLPVRHDADCVMILFENLILLKRHPEAVTVMRQLMDRQTQRGQQASADVARVQLAELHYKLGEYAPAVRYLNEALEHARDVGDAPFRPGSLLHQRARVHMTAGDLEQAETSWREAIRLDERLLAGTSGNVSAEEALAALIRLRNAYTETGQHTSAIAAARRIADYQTKRHGAEHRLSIEANAALGALYGRIGHWEMALPPLKASLEYWRAARPGEPEQLARALNNVASVERAIGSFDASETLFKEALRLRRQHSSADDPLLAEAYSNLASVYSARGQYATALTLYREALDVCRAAGPPAEGLTSLLLHNLSMAYRSQGQLAKAADFSRQALDIGRRVFDANPNSASAEELAQRYLAQAFLEVAGDNLAAARQACQEAITLCQQHGVANRPLIALAHRRLGTIHYQEQDAASAEKHWQAALDIQRRHGLRSEAARTLTMLADAAVQRDDFAGAEVLYRDALAQQEDYRVLPVVHYNALVNLAQLLYYNKGEQEEAVALLSAAIELLELPRAETEGGGEGHRAEFFSRHAAAFDLLVDWNLKAGRVADAILYAERGRNRTFLDQLRLAGVDLRDTLPDDETGRRLRVSEQQLATRVSSLRGLAVAAGRGELEGESLAELAEQLAQAQSEYALVLGEIRDHSPFYRELLAQRADIGSLAMIRRHVLTSANMLLIYSLGERQSYLIAVDGRQATGDAAPPRYFPLTITPQLAESLKVPAGPLSRETAKQLVGTFLATIRDRDGARGLAGVVRSPRGMMDADQGTALAEVLLPRDVRALISAGEPEHLVVVPDGALHQMPLEALLIESGPARYVLDQFPPITYAPSATILASLTARPDTNSDHQGLLTVGDPQYPAASEADLATMTDAGRSTFIDLGGVLSPLPGTATECQRVFGAFGSERATSLLSQAATESNVRASLENRQFVHLAAHGLVDERNDNLFGAIALTPPNGGGSEPEDDGFLRLHEIHSLRLAGCELAALSACRTNVGPRRPLEAGSTLARAFLAAGARRVVSSHWNVDDNASSELISLFFERLAEQIDQGEPVDYARLMHEARLSIRAQEKWSAPYYWAPFVLVGPAQ